MADISKLSDDELRKQHLQTMPDDELRSQMSEFGKRTPRTMLERLKEGTQFDPEARKQTAEQAQSGLRGLGLVARGALKGVASTAETLLSPIYVTPPWAKSPLRHIEPAVEKGLSAVGLPEPETTGEKILTGAGEFLPGLTAMGGKTSPRGIALSKIGAASEKGGMDAAHNAIMSAAQKEGYKVPPVTKTLGKIATEVAGKTETKAEMNINNRMVDTKIAAKEAGVPEGMPVTDEALAAARKEIGKPYDDLGKMSPKAGQLWKQAQRQRALAKAEYKKWRESQGRNPDALERAEHLDSRAAAKEKEIEDIASLIYQDREGGAAKLAELKNARQRFAKNYMVDRANTPGGQVLGEKISRDKGYKTGGLKLISDFHAEKARYFKDELDLLPRVHFGGGAGMHGLGLGGWISHLPLVGYGVRKAALTKMLQPDFGKYKPGITAKLADIGNKAALTRSALGLQQPESDE